MFEFDKGVPFYKMHGCGNDFIFMDNRALGLEQSVMVQWTKQLCRRAFGINADGMVFLSDAPKNSGLDYVWDFINKDGSLGEMCGNASRCTAMLAHRIGLAPAEHRFGTLAGPVRATVVESHGQIGIVKVLLPDYEDLELSVELGDLELEGQPVTAHYVVAGVPHAVVYVTDLDGVDVNGLGHAIRHHSRFAPKGTNVDFVRVDSSDTLSIRTYERGVEYETFACGTGAAASAVISGALGKTSSCSTVKTVAGFDLEVEVKDKAIYQQGPAQLVFAGECYPDGLNL